MTVNGGTAQSLCIGGIAGTLGAGITVENSYVRGLNVTTQATQATYVGGISGRTLGTGGTIKNCYTTGLTYTTGNTNNSAGIIGGCGNTAYKAENCYTTVSKLQGNATAKDSYMGETNCYTSSSIANAKTGLGLSFITIDSMNDGNPVLIWEYEKQNPTAEKKSVNINKIGTGIIAIAGATEATSINAYSEQNVSVTLAADEGYVLTGVSYNGNALKENDGKYSFNVGNGGELKVVFSEITDADAEFFVSASGSDSNDGTALSTAFKTIETAINAAKAYRGTKVINIEEGTYNVKETILLDADDNGIVLRAYENGNVVLNGGTNIDKAWFAPSSDNENILVADLKANGITSYGRIKSVGYGTYADSTDKNGSPVFTIDGKYQTIARYPNSGYIKTGQIITGSSKDSAENLSFKTSDSHASKWVNEKDAWVFGYFMEDWADAVLPVTVGADGVISANGKSSYGADSDSRFYVFNALSELDTEGEYYVDREEGKMYIYKLSNWDSVESMVFSAGDNNIVEINGAENVTLDSLTITNTNASGVVAKNADGLEIKDCTLSNIGNVALNVSSSENAIISGNTISDIGYVGILYREAGDRQTLTPNGSVIKDNTITRTGVQRNAGGYAIDITNTVGTLLSGNKIFDLPHGGILYMTCNDAIIEYNEIYNVIKETSDAGAIYSGRDWTTRGNIIRYNYIHDIVDINNVNNASAVYLDDMHSSTEIYGNVMYKVSQAILLGGGRDNTFTNNLIIDCNNWIEADMRGTRADLTYMKHMLSQVPYTSDEWSKYDNLVNILNDEPEKPKYNTIKDNVVYNSSGTNYPDLYNLLYSVGAPEKVTDTSFFYSYSDKEFGLSEDAKTIDSAAYNLIKDIPFAEMGFATAGTFEVENVEIKEDGNNLVASVKMINNTSEEFATKLIIAQYNGDELKMCSVKPVFVGKNAGVIEDSLTAAKDEATTSYKVFLWDANMKPLW